MRKKVFYNLILACLAACMVVYLIAPVSGKDQVEQEDVIYLAASTKQATEYEIKAVYLYNFLLFTSWPDEKDDEKAGDVCIGIVGKDPFGESFADIEGKMIKSLNKRLVIRRYGSYAEAEAIDGCRLIFVCQSERGNIPKILSDLEGARTLTVADVDGFLKSGGMIKLVKIKNKIRWEINLTPLEKANIKLSSQLLRSAVKIVEIPEVSDKENETEIAGGPRR